MADIFWFARNQCITMLVIFASLLSACGGGEGGSGGTDNGTGVVVIGSGNANGNTDNTGSGPTVVQGVSSNSLLTVSGVVIDGPVIDAIITVTDANNAFVAAARSDSQAKFSVQIPANSVFPLTVTAAKGVNLVTNTPPTFILMSAIMSAQDRTANINPFSTLIVKTAQKMPSGLIPANMDVANRNILAGLNGGLDTEKVPNPITTPITEQNVATMVKSSEVLAEIIRRNHSALSSVNNEVTQNALIDSLAADMTDGVLDGRGTPGVNITVSATATVASGQVSIEALSNTLQVNNAPATSQLDDSIRAIMPGTTETTKDLPVNMDILQNTQIALAIASFIAPNPGFAAIQTAITNIEVGSTAEQITSNLPGDTAYIFDGAVSAILDFADSGDTGIVEEILTNAPQLPTAEIAQKPYGGTPWPIPGRIEAEHYDEGGEGSAYSDTTLGNAGNYLRSDNVDIWVSTDTGSGYMVGTTRTGEWLEYTVNIVTTGPYLINMRVASPNGGKQARVLIDGVDITGAIAIPNTGGWQTWQTVSTHVNLSAGTRILRVQIDNGSFNLNAIEVLSDTTVPTIPNNPGTPDVDDPSPSSGTAQTPYGGTAWPVPGRIEAEHYDEGGDGVAYSDISVGNAGSYLRNDNVDIWISADSGGGYMVGTTTAGEWLEYTVNVPGAATYLMNLRVASAEAGKQARILANGIDITGAIAIPNTGGWQTWQTVSVPVNLNAGLQTLRIQIVAGSFNLNAIEISAYNSSANPPTSNGSIPSTDNTTLTLTWKPNPESVDGYLVYFGSSSDTAINQVSDIKAFSGTFDFSAPAIQYDSWHDLGLQLGQNVCFKLKAYNADGLSGWSQTICGLIPRTTS